MARPGFALGSALLLLGLVSATRAEDASARYEKIRKIAIGGEGGGTSSKSTPPTASSTSPGPPG